MQNRTPVKVLLVDDSALVRSILRQALSEAEGITVVGEASNGLRACEINRDLHPDVIIMDINMPVMDGLEATKKIMAENPVPIIIFSSAIDARVSFEAVSIGAVDIIQKPDIDRINSPDFISGLVGKMRLALESGVFGKNFSNSEPVAGSSAVFPETVRAVVIGASTGGPLAVRDLLAGLPGDLPTGIAVVQHLEENFDQGYAEWLNGLTELNVRLAVDNDSFTPGEVLIAPVNRHLAVRNGRLNLEDTPFVQNQKPAVDVLFSTAADYYGRGLLGVLLTGMGRDGADGCLRIRNNGGHTLVQDRATSAIFGMPRAAIEAGAASEVLPLPEISGRILSFLEVC